MPYNDGENSASKTLFLMVYLSVPNAYDSKALQDDLGFFLWVGKSQKIGISLFEICIARVNTKLIAS